MKPIILFRQSVVEKEELEIANKHFETTFSRVNLENRLVIPRYSALPFYKELEADIKAQGSKLINSFAEHNYIANFDYYHDINENKINTPLSYFDLMSVPKNLNGYVIKGRTNSNKHQWNKKMFAKNYEDLKKMYFETLENSPLLSDQGIIIREYIPLKTFEIGINDLPFTNEWRFFFYKKDILSYGYYWSSADNIPKKESLPPEAIKFAEEMAEIMSQTCTFFVIDIAETHEGKWIMIEANDGQQSGLSENLAEELYSNLLKKVSE